MSSLQQNGPADTSIKSTLLKYWQMVTKTLNEDFEEILQFGENSDVNDILNSLFIIEDARQESIKNDEFVIQTLGAENETLKSQLIQEQKENQILINKGSKHNDMDSKLQEIKELEKQLMDVSQIMLQSNRKLELSQQENQDISQQLKKRDEEIRTQDKRINELNHLVLQLKEDKLLYMEQTQNQIQLLKEKEFQLNQKLLQLQQLDQRKSSRNSADFQEDYTRSQQSPNSRLKPVAARSSDSLKIAYKKVEQVAGSGQSSFRFGK